MLNNVILQGTLGHTPTCLTMDDGKEILFFSLGTQAPFRVPTGNGQSSMQWHHVAVLRHSTVEWLKECAQKGDLLVVEGILVYFQGTQLNNQSCAVIPLIIVSEQEGKVEALWTHDLNSHFQPKKTTVKKGHPHS